MLVVIWARPWRPIPRGVLALGMIRHSAPPFPFRHGGGGWRCADPGASHPSAAAAASGDPVTSRASLSATAGGAGGWSGASMASIPPRRAVLVVVIRHAQGVPSTTAWALVVVIPARSWPLFLPSLAGVVGGADPGVPFPPRLRALVVVVIAGACLPMVV